MGGGPRTYPGGVNKWQWKRMQEKKAKQVEKARLLRERQTYERRRRAELMAATPSLEKPWEKLSRFRPPGRFTADEQIKTLASRFEKRGAEDLWTDEDGPESFLTPDGLPSARFFPPNAVYSTRMYTRVDPPAAAQQSLEENLMNLETHFRAENPRFRSRMSEGFVTQDFGPSKPDSNSIKNNRWITDTRRSQGSSRNVKPEFSNSKGAAAYRSREQRSS